MNYQDGVTHMVNLVETKNSGSFNVGELLISYPGKKEKGDYKLTIGGYAPTHADIVNEIYQHTNNENFDDVVSFGTA